MSLVGSLEDLGLGDILQIVSLSRKSGLLLLRSDSSSGRIILLDGQVRGGFVEGESGTLRELLVGGGFVAADDFKLAEEAASARGVPLDEAIAEHTGFATERIDSLRRERVEHAVLAMLGWRTGEFSFEVRKGVEERDAELLIATGINAQYLAMEATRLRDEPPESPADAPGPEADEPEDEEPVFSGESQAQPARPEPAAGPVESVSVGSALPSMPGRGEAPMGDAGSLGGPDPESAPAPRVSLVAIDPDLCALEWLKATLGGLFARIHIFQSSEAGVARVRQYLARAQRPVVLLSTATDADPARGASGASALLQRLRGLAPGMPVLLLHDGRTGPGELPEASGVVQRPASYLLAERRAWGKQEASAEAFRETLAPWAAPASTPRKALAGPVTGRPQGSASTLERFKAISERLRDPSKSGEVVSSLLEFTADLFSRVAIFVLRDRLAVGVAQVGMPKAGGPDDEALRDIEVPVDKSAWFREVVARRASHRAPPSDRSDRQLAELLGEEMPKEAYIAPIENGGDVVALLYADNLPGSEPLGDTTALEIVLHEAGPALDRALLERGLAEVEG